MTIATENTCMNCNHRHQDQCRRYPQQVTVVPIPVQTLQGAAMKMQAIGGWPLADKDTWCGEWAGTYRLQQ